MELFLEGDFILERFSGKGGWTYIKIPREELPGGKAFGMYPVSGSIDGFSFDEKHLMPMGDGNLFLPVAKPIRKKINKEAGDMVQLKLSRYQTEVTSIYEIEACLKDDPDKWELFQALEKKEQEKWIQFITEASTVQKRVDRIIKLLASLV